MIGIAVPAKGEFIEENLKDPDTSKKLKMT
jgi:hypothetical protein